MKIKSEKYGVGVVIGRFQVPELHSSHNELIKHVTSEHPKVIILLGVSSMKGTRSNSLDFQMRRQMIQGDYPDINILLIEDCVSDEIWSKNVDKIINSVITPGQKVVLYGSRDSFISHYHGRFPTLVLEADSTCSGTEIRNQVSIQAVNSPDFRKGVIWSAYNQFPRVFTTVDIAVVKYNSERNDNQILLARKPNEKLYRFVGGFAEPNSECFELDALRELHEEVGAIEVTHPKYLGSFKVQDWRLAKEVDKVKTLFFVCDYMFGQAVADDDIEEVKWFWKSEINENYIVLEHRKMFNTLLDYIEKGK